MNGPDDWTNTTVQLSGIPMSCCSEEIGAIGTINCNSESQNLHKDGCIYAFTNFAERHAAKIAGVGIGLGVIQVLSQINIDCFERCFCGV